MGEKAWEGTVPTSVPVPLGLLGHCAGGHGGDRVMLVVREPQERGTATSSGLLMSLTLGIISSWTTKGQAIQSI